MLRSAPVRGPSSGFGGRLAIGVTIVTIALVLVSGSGADRAVQARPSPSGLRNHAAALDERAHRALLDLYSIETQLGYAQGRLAALQRETERIRAEQRLARRQIGIARRALDVSRGQLAQRLRLLYERGDPDPLAVLLGATSLEDAISSLDDLARTNRQSKDVIQETKATQRSLARRLELLANRGARLATLTRQGQDTEARLALVQAQRRGLLASLRTKARLDRRRIAALEATARAAETKSQALAAPQTTVSAPAQPAASAVAGPSTPAPVTPSAVDGARTLTVVATGYSLPGHTATGLPVGWGIVAVDPAVIPLGTHMNIPGYGDAVAADVGSAVRGTMIDLWFPTLAQARAWGRRQVTITLG